MKKAIIIGASSGIGKELAITLAKNGYEVGLMARRIELLEVLKNEIPTKTHVGHIDLSKVPEAIEKIKNMIQAMQGVDLVVINSGTGFLNPELDWSKEQQTLDVNVYGFCAIAGEVYKFFAKEGQGHVVGISSIGALRGNPIAPAYNASKAFMSNYLEGLRKKAFQEKFPIVVSDIKPGFVDTEMAKGEGKFWVATPQKAAEQIYSAIHKQKQHAYITHRWRLISWILKLMPNWLYQRVG
ncbi:MAG: oxidoreductase [Chlamydia sp. 32-24]|nr:MAG: oxidoreductase [Chlamydia sp. 32-24]